MSSRLKKHGLLIVIAVVALFLTVEHGYGATIQYIYDENGNLVEKRTVQTADTTPPTTTAVPAGGTFGSALQVALSCHDGSGSGCDKTYYSTDGSTPTTVYSSPISISATTALKFFSKDKAGNNEGVRTEIYTISPGGPDTTPPVTTPTPPEGFYASAQSVTLTCTDTGGSGCDKIYYTIDGTTPTTSSAVYSAPINITVTTTLKFFAKDHAGNTEAVNTAVYVIDRTLCSDPPVKIGSTGYSTIQAAYNVAQTGDVIKCREQLTFVENLTVNQNIAVTLEGGWGCGYARGDGIKTTIQGMLTTTPGGGTLTIKNIILAKAPTTPPTPPDTTPPTTIAYPPGGIYDSAQSVLLVCTDAGGSVCYDIHYTTNGSNPDPSSPVYSTPINISTTTTLKFFARDAAGNTEAVKTQLYTIDTSLPTTIATPSAGSYYEPKVVTLSCTDASGSGCEKIYYTTDGTTPTIFSAVYSTPFNISETTTLKFFGEDFAGNTEPVKTAAYIIDPSLCTNPLVRIGSTPYSKLRAAYDAAPNGATIQCRNMTFAESLNTNRNISVTLEGGWDCGYTTTAGGKTTIDGSLTTSAGTLTLKNFIIGKSSFPTDHTPPTTTATPAGGTYDTSLLVFLTCDDGSGSGCDKIYYTTDGSTPITTSPVYSGPIDISVTTTLKFFARDLAGNSEAVKTQVYTINRTNAAIKIVDFDGDGRSDIAVYRASNGFWYIMPSSGAPAYQVGWGGDPSDKPVPGDYDGDGKTDIAVYRASNGLWYIKPSSGAPAYQVGWGGDPSDRPVPGDYDGDGKTDIAFYRGGSWYIMPSSGAPAYQVGWGGDPSDKPVPGDYDGDGKTDVAVYRASNGIWYIMPSSGAPAYQVGWGGDPSDRPVPGDYDGDGKTDIAFYRGGGWFIIPSSTGIPYVVAFGGDPSDKPVPGDYDGDGKTDIAVYRASTGFWYILPSSGAPAYQVGWGGDPSDVPINLVYTLSGTDDITPPTTTATPAGGTYIAPQSVTLTCNDGSGTGCDKIYYTTNGSTPSTSSPVYSSPINISTTTTLKFFAKDRAGNSEAVKTQTYTIDTSPPTGTITINAGAAYTNSTNVTLTLSCNDANGCSQMQFSNDNVTYSTPETYATSKAWSLTTGDGSKTVYVKFKDTPGNWSLVYTYTILLDTTLPTTTASPAGGTYGSAQSVTLSCSDASGSGCDKIYYTTDGSTPTTSSPIYSSPINISATTTLKFFTKDLAANSEAMKTQTYTIDTSPPTGTITINSGAAYTNSTNVTLTLSCNDANGCSQMQFSNDNVTYLTAETYATSKAWSLTTGDGSKTVYVKFKDTSGNWSVPYSAAILLDTTPPTSTTTPAGGTYTSAQSVTLSCSDGSGSGCDKIYYTTDGTTPTASSPVYSSPVNISVTATLKFFAKDLAANSEAVKTQTYTINTGGGCSNPPVKIGGTFYSTLQSAYDAAVTGDTIKCQIVTFIENLIVNRNIIVRLEGGYDCGYTTNYGNMSVIRGMIRTTSGGGKITIKNFIVKK